MFKITKVEKMNTRNIFFLISIIFAISCENDKKDMNETMAPIAKKVPKELIVHNDVRVDNYYWLNNKEDQEVINYLKDENSYYESLTTHTKDFEEELFLEMKGRIKEDDSSVPYKKNGYWYVTRFEKGKEYPIFSRHKDTLEAPEEIMFNGNEMAKGHEYFKIGGISISPDNSLAVFSVDTISRRQYTLKIKNLITGEIYQDIIEDTTGAAVWANDNKTIFYTKKDSVTLRSDKVYRHKFTTNAVDDILIFQEEDDTFGAGVFKTKSKKYIVIISYSTLTTEMRILNADTPEEEFTIFSPRVRGLEYSISHYNDCFYVLTNRVYLF